MSYPLDREWPEETALSIKEEVQMGFVYEDITPELRAQIGMLAVVNRGAYGMVTRLARELGTSRKFVYVLADKVSRAVKEAVQPLVPGPKAECGGLVVDRQQLDRVIVRLGVVGKVAERPMVECLKEIYRVEPSLGYINGVLARASQAARQFNRERSLAIAEAQVEADELYACGQAHLVAVEHSSLLIRTLEQPERCDGKAWEESLGDLRERGVDLARLGSDGGRLLGPPCPSWYR